MSNPSSSLRLRRYSGTLSVMLRVADALVCIGAGLLAFVVRFGVRGIPDAYQIALAVATLLVLILFPLLRVYQAFRTRSVALPSARVIAAWLCVVVAFLVLSVLMGSGDRFSREWIAIWFGLGMTGFVGLRLCIFAGLRLLRRRGRNVKRIALVGNGPLAVELQRRVAREKWMGFEIAGHYGGEAGSFALEGSLKTRAIDEIWIATTLDEGELVRDVFELAKPYPVTVRYAPDLRELFLLNHGITEMAGLPMIDLTAGPLQGMNGLSKRIEDVVLASLIFVVTVPVMAAIALAVKLTSEGPVIFKQRRHGWDGRIIKVYKFRTMRVHGEKEIVVQACRNDERVTPVGRFLRCTSLDELPQLFNVLQGRMSLVGPRPHACQHNLLYQAQIEGYMLRHKMPPGITGWAQVHGLRGETRTLDRMEARVKLDLYYIEHWSLWLDLEILALTLVHGFASPNAY